MSIKVCFLGAARYTRPLDETAEKKFRTISSLGEGFVAALAVKFAAWFGYKVGLAVEVHGDFAESLFLYRRIRFGALHRFLMKQAALYSLAHADVLRAISSSTTNQLKRWAPQTTIV